MPFSVRWTEKLAWRNIIADVEATADRQCRNDTQALPGCPIPPSHAGCRVRDAGSSSVRPPPRQHYEAKMPSGAHQGQPQLQTRVHCQPAPGPGFPPCELTEQVKPIVPVREALGGASIKLDKASTLFPPEPGAQPPERENRRPWVLPCHTSSRKRAKASCPGQIELATSKPSAPTPMTRSTVPRSGNRKRRNIDTDSHCLALYHRISISDRTPAFQ